LNQNSARSTEVIGLFAAIAAFTFSRAMEAVNEFALQHATALRRKREENLGVIGGTFDGALELDRGELRAASEHTDKKGAEATDVVFHVDGLPIFQMA
jgi:hypothetical protein